MYLVKVLQFEMRSSIERTPHLTCCQTPNMSHNRHGNSHSGSHNGIDQQQSQSAAYQRIDNNDNLNLPTIIASNESKESKESNESNELNKPNESYESYESYESKESNGTNGTDRIHGNSKPASPKLNANSSNSIPARKLSCVRINELHGG